MKPMFPSQTRRQSPRTTTSDPRTNNFESKKECL
ncbi:hypothetical protein CBM2633_B10503 [Cupriavidus taiwanensis]|nr:hypothetical protein CBM2604_B130117 [Cupriavidus taiwanensis]SPA18273.1 hypothetical protein CBM2633_B10503 [Cupriavidus taiwanensis]